LLGHGFFGATYPVCLDFEGVEAMGSSFGEEIIPVLAAKQKNQILVKNANETVQWILKDIALDMGIKIDGLGF
jgi:hypothetical protein